MSESRSPQRKKSTPNPVPWPLASTSPRNDNRDVAYHCHDRHDAIETQDQRPHALEEFSGHHAELASKRSGLSVLGETPIGGPWSFTHLEESYPPRRILTTCTIVSIANSRLRMLRSSSVTTEEPLIRAGLSTKRGQGPSGFWSKNSTGWGGVWEATLSRHMFTFTPSDYRGGALRLEEILVAITSYCSRRESMLASSESGSTMTCAQYTYLRSIFRRS